MLSRLLLLTLASALLTACGGGDSSVSPPPPQSPTYQYFFKGQPQAAVQISPPQEPSTVIIGGSTDVDSAFQWMIERGGVRPGTGGRFVVLRAAYTEPHSYNDYIYYSNKLESTTAPADLNWVGGAALGLTSVETLVIPDRQAADDPFVNDVLAHAQAVFITGGDQANYIRYWKKSRLHTTLNQLMARNVPIGGTSAGMAVLGQFDFSALHDSVGSAEALADPFNSLITLDPDPLSLTGGFLTPGSFKNAILDSHFDARNRMGRLMGFVSRLIAPVGTSGCAGGILAAGTSPLNGARGIGVSEETALLVQGDGKRSPFTARRAVNPDITIEGAIYFLRPLQAPAVCASGKPLTAYGMEISKLKDDAVFNLSDWTGLPTYTIDVVSGELSREPY